MITIGWLGNFLLAICGSFEAYASYKKGNSNISTGFLYSWFFGEILTAIYVLHKGDAPLSMNYLLNLCFIVIIIKYKHFPRKDDALSKHIDSSIYMELENEYIDKDKLQ